MASALHLQARDISLLAELGEYGLFDTDIIHERHFPQVSRRRCQQRLQLHREQGLIRGVVLSVWYADARKGRVPAVFGLTERGAGAVEQATGERPRRFLRSEPKPETLQHRLAVVKTRLAFDDGCRLGDLQEPHWLMEQDRRSDARTDEAPSRQRVLYHEFSDGGKKITCQPDAACLLHIPLPAGRPQCDPTPLIVFWEIDRSTERRAQVMNKCPGYAALINRQEFRRYFPITARPAVRVFFVCISRGRALSLAQVMREHPISPYLRFSCASELDAASILSSPVWMTVDGQHRSIIRQDSSAHTH